MPKKIKIMHIINNLEIGGAEKMLVLLLNELAKRDDIELFLVSLEGHGILEADIDNRVKIKNFNYRIFTKFSRIDPNIRLSLLSYIKHINPDIVHGHLFKGEDFAKVCGFLTKIPVVTTAHDILIKPTKFRKFFNKYTKKATAVSQLVAEHLKTVYGFSDEQIVVIPNAIDTELFEKGAKKFDKQNPVFIYIGRILKSKGIDDAIIGLSKLLNNYPRLKFLVYGKEVHKKDKTDLEKLILKNKFKFVEFMGLTDNVPVALSTGDIFVLPSRSEGFAISALEAAAAKKPVVATMAGAIPEIVSNGISGILVDYDSPDQIYQACKKILDNNLVEKFGNEAKKIANSKFDKNKVADMYVDLYKSIINK